MNELDSTPLKFIIGDLVTYTSIVDGDQVREEATVVGVHHDDFPNIYYTVFMSTTKREKQTDSSRLSFLHRSTGIQKSTIGKEEIIETMAKPEGESQPSNSATPLKAQKNEKCLHETSDENHDNRTSPKYQQTPVSKKHPRTVSQQAGVGADKSKKKQQTCICS